MRSVSSELLGRLWIANTYWPALKIVPNGAIGDSEDFTWPRNARCCDMEDWPDADELDCCRLLEMPGGMAVGCGADNRRAPSLSNRENPPQIQAGVCRLPEGGLCKSYTALLARSSAFLKSFPIPIVTGRITVRSVKPIIL